MLALQGLYSPDYHGSEIKKLHFKGILDEKEGPLKHERTSFHLGYLLFGIEKNQENYSSKKFISYCHKSKVARYFKSQLKIS